MKSKKIVKIISASCIALALLCCIGGMAPKLAGNTAESQSMNFAMEDPPFIMPWE